MIAAILLGTLVGLLCFSISIAFSGPFVGSMLLFSAAGIVATLTFAQFFLIELPSHSGDLLDDPAHRG